MARIGLLYGKGRISVDIPDERLVGVLATKGGDAGANELELVREALQNPIGSARLSELAIGKKNIVVIASDHTRPVPSRIIIPPMLEELRAKNCAAEISILISTGCHRLTTREELIAKFGEEIVANERIIVHDCDKGCVSIGSLPSGGDLVLNKIALDADLLVAEGFIEPHFFAGFSGGRKSVLPGIASRKTVMYNHNAAFIEDERSRTGVLDGNPIHRDMVFAAEKARLAFIVNVVLGANKRVIGAFAGHFDKAHAAGCEFAKAHAKVAPKPADIAITTNGGYPLDQNIYQAVKGLTAAEATCREGGVIIIAAECSDGHGGLGFLNTFRQGGGLNEILDVFLKTPADETVVDQWQSQIHVRVLKRFTVIMVTDAEREYVEDLRMRYAGSVDEALRMAEEILGNPNASVVAIPDGVSVIVGE